MIPNALWGKREGCDNIQKRHANQRLTEAQIAKLTVALPKQLCMEMKNVWNFVQNAVQD
jgi:hypothetical protein